MLKHEAEAVALREANIQLEEYGDDDVAFVAVQPDGSVHICNDGDGDPLHTFVPVESDGKPGVWAMLQRAREESSAYLWTAPDCYFEVQ